MSLAGEAPLKGLVPVKHLVEDDAERPDIGTRVEVVSFHLLRRHVVDGAENRAWAVSEVGVARRVIPRQ